MTPKDKKIVEDAEKLGIPVFVLTAKDLATTNTLLAYLNECEDLKCNEDHLKGIKVRMKEFAEWQSSNKNLTKVPD